jgi:hypothetical protein
MATIKNIWIEGGAGSLSSGQHKAFTNLEIEPWIRGFRLRFGESMYLPDEEFDKLAYSLKDYVTGLILQITRDSTQGTVEEIALEIPKPVDTEETKKEIKTIKKVKKIN